MDSTIPEFFLEDYLDSESESETSYTMWEDIPEPEDEEYLESAPFQKWNAPEIPGPPGLVGPEKPLHWNCEPAWHFDRADSPPISEWDISDSDNSMEEGSIPTASKNRRNRKRKKKLNGYKRAKVNQELKEVHTARRVNLPGLQRRTRNRQPPTLFQRTPEQILASHKIFTRDEIVHGLKISDSSRSGCMLVHLFPMNTLPSDIYDILVKSHELYQSSVVFPINNYKINNKRGSYTTQFLGCWYKSGRYLQPYMTAHYRGPGSGRHYKRVNNPYYLAAKRFRKANQRLFSLIEDLIKMHYPDIYQLYNDIQVPEGCHKFAGLFAAVVINNKVQTNLHKDLGDIKGGICIIVNWGSFNGGDLVFSELQCVVPFPAGSIIIFRSAILSHYNMPVHGLRYSMVFMTDKRLKRWSDKQLV